MSRRLPALQTQLRKLYLCVHPDLFAGHDVARVQNTKALAHMNALVHELKAHDVVAVQERTRKLVFHVLQGEATRSVGFELRLPKRNGAYATHLSKNKTQDRMILQRAFQSLFHECGFEPSDFVWDGFFESAQEDGPIGQDWEDARAVHMLDFIQECAERSRSRRAYNTPAMQEIATLMDLFRKKMYRFTFRQFQTTSLPSMHSHLRLFNATFVDPLKYRHLHFILNAVQGTGTDHLGRFMLSPRETAQRWLKMARFASDLPFKQKQELKKQELSLARELGICDIFADPNLLYKGDPWPYMSYISTLGQHKREFQWLPSYARPVRIMIVPQGTEGGIQVDPLTGIVHVPLFQSASSLAHFLYKEPIIIKAVEQHDAYFEDRREYDALMSDTRHRLGLETLEKDDSIAREDMVRCCQRLQQLGRHNMRDFSGQNLVVSNRFFFQEVGFQGKIHIHAYWSLL